MDGPSGGPRLLVRRALRNGVDGARLGAFLGLLVQLTWTAPAGFAARRRARRGALPPLAHPPLFILGHYRSGTTLLHKLLAADPMLGSIDTFDLLWPFAPSAARRRIVGPLQAVIDRVGLRQGFFHEYRLRLDDPNELEPWLLATGSRWSSYWGYLFPRRALDYLERFVRFRDAEERAGWQSAYEHALRDAAARKGGRRMVVKDPPNTGRIRALLEVWPGALFVHVVRDPREVLLSMRELWRTTILPRFSLQRVDEAAVADVVLSHYETLMERWLAERRDIAPGRSAEVRYEDLVRAPLEQVRRVFDELPLHPFDAARAAVEARLTADRTYRPARHGIDDPLPRGWERAITRWRRVLGYGGERVASDPTEASPGGAESNAPRGPTAPAPNARNECE